MPRMTRGLTSGARTIRPFDLPRECKRTPLALAWLAKARQRIPQLTTTNPMPRPRYSGTQNHVNLYAAKNGHEFFSAGGLL